MQIHPMDKADPDYEAIEAHANDHSQQHIYMHHYPMHKADLDCEAIEAHVNDRS
jgi:hypothetical protein